MASALSAPMPRWPSVPNLAAHVQCHGMHGNHASTDACPPRLQVGIVQFSNDVRVELQPVSMSSDHFQAHVTKMVSPWRPRRLQ